jgi:hypothetical protein
MKRKRMNGSKVRGRGRNRVRKGTTHRQTYWQMLKWMYMCIHEWVRVCMYGT